MFHKNRCYNGGSQHKFEARYTEEGINKESGGGFTSFNIKAKGYTVEELKEALHKKIYLHDICVWCGKKVEKK